MSLRRSFLSRKFSSKSSSRDPNALGGILPLSASDFDHASALPGGSGGDRMQAESAWSSMLPELLREIIQRVEASEDAWPNRHTVVSCACVCKRWRDITKEIVRATPHSGKITFPSCLKQVFLRLSFDTFVRFSSCDICLMKLYASYRCQNILLSSAFIWFFNYLNYFSNLISEVFGID